MPSPTRSLMISCSQCSNGLDVFAWANLYIFVMSKLESVRMKLTTIARFR